MSFLNFIVDSAKKGIEEALNDGKDNPKLIKLFSELSMDINDYPIEINERVQKFCSFLEKLSINKKEISLLEDMKSSAYTFDGDWNYGFFKQFSLPVKIKFSILIDYIRACLDEKNELDELDNLGKKLGLNKELIKHARVIYFNAFIQKQFNSGNPDIYTDSDSILLQKEEYIVLELPATLIEEKSETVRKGNSSGASVRIAKGLWIHAGGNQSKSEKTNYLSYKSEGNLIFTNQRIVFSGETASFIIKKQNIVSVENNNGIIYFHSNKAKPDIIELDIPMLDKTLKSVIKWIINQ